MNDEEMKHEGPLPRSSCFIFWCFIIVAILQFCLFLNHRDVTTPHEGRVLQTSREMLQRRDWIVPYCNGVPRLAKPPLGYWVTDVAWAIGRRYDVWLARLPAALCGAIAVVLMLDLARRSIGRDGAICAGLVWISTWFIVDEYRKAMADPYLAFFALAAVWAWIAAQQARSKWLLLVAYTAAALAALAKGHLILIHLPLALIPYHLTVRRRPIGGWIHLMGVLLLLVIASAWPLYIWRTVPNAWETWRVDVLASEATSGAKRSPLLQYLYNVPLTAAPWTPFLIVGALMPILGKTRFDRRARWPLAWLALTVIVFSMVSMKKNTYLLPAMPAQTLLAAAGLVGTMRWLRKSWHVPILDSMRILVILAIVLMVAVDVAEWWLIPRHDNRRSDRQFAQIVRDRAAGSPLIFIGPGLREDVLFYLDGRIVPRADELRADFRGFAMIASDQLVQHFTRGELVARSNENRSPRDWIWLYRVER